MGTGKREIAEETWNHWYHCMGNTYGTWLPGSPKGFRTRHHREHVEGDYQNPPPEGRYDERLRKSKSLLARDPVYLNLTQRRRAVEEIVKSLQKRRIEVLVVSVDRVHFHLVARFPDRNPRHWVGVAKKESSHYLKVEGLAPVGGLWAVRFECVPVADRGHQVMGSEVRGEARREGGVGVELQMKCSRRITQRTRDRVRERRRSNPPGRRGLSPSTLPSARLRRPG